MWVRYPIPTLKRFTAEQAELYLRLMPRGYATEEELPELITFWKSRIIENDPDQTFAVGIMVGVSGCGKSSMLEAGLVPALPESIIPILIEASESDTEVRILNKLRRALPEADPDKKWSLVDWTFRLRSGNVLPQGKKVVFVLDQFEQWLNAHGGEPTNQLLDALHQCDGQHLQAIVCVREGFHATLMRFVEALSFKLDEERNYATAHRFTPDHARFVLTQFGRGLKRVNNPPTTEQQAFIDATIDALAESDRGVVCVRLVVLALVMQDRPWSVEELKQLGGLDGIGSQLLAPLLEQTINSPDEKRTQLHARLASVQRDTSLVEPLVEELLTGKLAYAGPIRELLKPRSSQLSDTFWQVLRDETGDADRRFRAGLALAEYSPPSESEIDPTSKSESDSAADLESKTWTEPLFSFMAEQLVSANAEFQPMLRGLLSPIQARLLPDLERIFESAAATDVQRLSAANAFADYAASDVGKLSTLLAVATPEQYAVIYPLVAADPTPSVIDDLGKIAATLPREEMGSVPRISFGQSTHCGSRSSALQ